MRRPHIPEALRRAVAEEAKYRCGYFAKPRKNTAVCSFMSSISRPTLPTAPRSFQIFGWPVPCATATKARELTASIPPMAKCSRSLIHAHKLGSNISFGARTVCLCMVKLRLGERRLKPSNLTTNTLSPRTNIGCVSDGIRPANDELKFAI